MVFMRKRKIASACSATCDVLVGVPGLEPGKAGPESAVLPLHHTPISGDKVSANRVQKSCFLPRCSLTSQSIFSKCAAKVMLFSEPTKKNGTFLIKKCVFSLLFRKKPLPLQRISRKCSAKSGCISAKSKLSALDLH